MRGIANPNPQVEFTRKRRKYISCSSYGTTLARYRSEFGEDQVLVIDFDTYVADMDSVTERVLDFLNLPVQDLSMVVAPNRSVGSNRSLWSPVYYLDYLLAFSPMVVRRLIGRRVSIKLRSKPTIPAELASKLRNELIPEMALLEELTGLDTSNWRESGGVN
jgi:hypothetical protein